MSELKTKFPTDTWMEATWDEYIKIIDDPAYAKAKGYYYNGKLRLEMTVGSDHSRDHTIVILAASLFAALKGIPMNGRDNCTYRKPGVKEAQPDMSYYIGKDADVIPWGTSIVNLDIYPAPTLAIEVANTSLADDKTEKRRLYQDLKVKEYWVVDVQNVLVIAFAMADGGSRQITESQVLPGLEISLLEEALRRSRQIDQSQVITWLLSQFQK